MALFIVRAITQFMSAQNLRRAVIVQNLEFSGSHEMKMKLSFSGTIRFPLQRTISSLLFRGSSSSWDQSTNISRMVYCCDWLERQYSSATDRFHKNDISCLIWTYYVLSHADIWLCHCATCWNKILTDCQLTEKLTTIWWLSSLNAWFWMH